jgi:hypothetical protein
MEEIEVSKRTQTKVRHMLEELVEKRVLSKAGLQWLTIAVDPWHDTTVVGLEGIPDEGIGKSVSFQIVQEYAIAKNRAPVTLPPGNWSCRIANYPFIDTQAIKSGQYRGDVVSQSGVSFTLTPVQVNYATDGADFPDHGIAGISGGCSIPQEYTKGILKIIGMGIEVVNTTAQLNKQGLMTCIRMVQPDTETYTAYISMETPANAWAIKSMNSIRTVPKNLSEMTLYPSLVQDEAATGYYAPVNVKWNHNKRYPTSAGVLLMTEDPHGGFQNEDILCYSSAMTAYIPAGTTTTFYSNRTNPVWAPQDSNVVMFTGLSDSTTLNLRVRWICERFPSDSEPQMLVIATPSAPYDPVALEIYSKIVQEMKAGVPFSENPKGEWWATMLGSIGRAIAPMVSMLPNVGKFLGPAIGLGAGALESYALSEKEKREARKLLTNKQRVNSNIVPTGVNAIRKANGPPAPPKNNMNKNRRAVPFKKVPVRRSKRARSY